MELPLSELVRKRVLIVDDEELIVEALVDLFEGTDFIVEGADSGSSAIKMCEQTQFDIVISDICMDDGDGFALANWLFERHGKDVPVVFVTGYLNEAKKELPKNVIDLLKKPINFGEFVSVVEKYLEV